MREPIHGGTGCPVILGTTVYPTQTEGFVVHTFRLVNERGAGTFVKFHWKPRLGTHSLNWAEAQKIRGKDPGFNRRDLWEAIEAGQYQEWQLGVQLVAEADEFSSSTSIFSTRRKSFRKRVFRCDRWANGAEP